MKNESFLPDNQFLRVRTMGDGLHFALGEYSERRLIGGAARFVSSRELDGVNAKPVRLGVIVEMLEENLEGYKKQRKGFTK